MSKNGSLIVFNNLYSEVTNAVGMPQLIRHTRADDMFVYYDQAYICLIHFYKRCVSCSILYYYTFSRAKESPLN